MGVDVLKGENRASDNVPVKSRPSKKKRKRNGVGCLDVSKTKLKVGPLITISNKEMKPKEQNT